MVCFLGKIVKWTRNNNKESFRASNQGEKQADLTQNTMSSMMSQIICMTSGQQMFHYYFNAQQWNRRSSSPKQSGFVGRAYESNTNSSQQNLDKYSVNNVTLTTLTPR